MYLSHIIRVAFQCHTHLSLSYQGALALVPSGVVHSASHTTPEKGPDVSLFLTRTSSRGMIGTCIFSKTALKFVLEYFYVKHDRIVFAFCHNIQ